MNEKVKTQILAIRDTGETNMLDVPVVSKIAQREGYRELFDYLENHIDQYIRFILTGDPQKE